MRRSSPLAAGESEHNRTRDFVDSPPSPGLPCREGRAAPTMVAMSNRQALADVIGTLDGACPALVELARTLAAALDERPEQGMAALAKEYRATLKELTTGGHPDAFSALLAEMGNAP